MNGDPVPRADLPAERQPGLQVLDGRREVEQVEMNDRIGKVGGRQPLPMVNLRGNGQTLAGGSQGNRLTTAGGGVKRQDKIGKSFARA